jgi:hypothetical protein
MIADALVRLGIALPLVLLVLVGTLVAARRGWIPFAFLGAAPGLRTLAPGRAGVGNAGAPALDLVAIRALGPAQRIAVVRWRGEELLLGIGQEGIRLLARSGAGPRIGAPGAEEAP